MEGRIGKNYKIAVLGNELLTLGFRFAGIVQTFSAKSQADAESKFRELLQKEDIGIIIITSMTKRLIMDRKLQETITSSIMPLVVEIPEPGEENVEEDTLRKLILRAIGLDITKTISR